MLDDLKRPDDGALISIPGGAWELQCSAITIRRMIRAGRLKAVRFSATLVRVERAAIAKLIEEANC
jgi:excisionase family DNA binding protein